VLGAPFDDGVSFRPGTRFVCVPHTGTTWTKLSGDVLGEFHEPIN
jgi:hypothetical protein